MSKDFQFNGQVYKWRHLLDAEVDAVLISGYVPKTFRLRTGYVTRNIPNALNSKAESYHRKCVMMLGLGTSPYYRKCPKHA